MGGAQDAAQNYNLDERRPELQTLVSVASLPGVAEAVLGFTGQGYAGSVALGHRVPLRHSKRRGSVAQGEKGPCRGHRSKLREVPSIINTFRSTQPTSNAFIVIILLEMLNGF